MLGLNLKYGQLSRYNVLFWTEFFIIGLILIAEKRSCKNKLNSKLYETFDEQYNARITNPKWTTYVEDYLD